MAQQTYLVRKGGDADLNNVTIAGTLTVTGAAAYDGAAFLDDETLGLGTGDETTQDVTATWDGTNLVISALADDELIEIGDSAVSQKSFDIKLYGNAGSGASYLYFDASADLLYTTGIDVQFKDNDVLVFGSGAGATGDVTLKWDATDLEMAATGASAAWNIGAASHVLNVTHVGTVTVGADDTGYDVKFYGATSGKSLLWDESADKLILTGALAITGDSVLTGALTVGTDGTGHDVLLYGDTAGCSLLWDQSEDQLVVTGPADVPALKLAGAGSISAAAYAGVGDAWADGGTPAFKADQKYMLIDIAGTTYRIPLFANA